MRDSPSGSKLVLFSLATLLLLSILSTTSYAEQVFSVSNLILDKEEIFTTEVQLVQYAPHNMTSTIQPVYPNTTAIAITIHMEGETQGARLELRANRRERTVEFIPINRIYNLTIENTGQLDNVTVGFTILQTGEPPTQFYDQRDVFAVLLPVITLIIGPVLGLAFLLLVYRWWVLRKQKGAGRNRHVGYKET